MWDLFSEKLQMASIIMVSGVGVLASVDNFSGMSEVFLRSGSLGVLLLLPTACAIGLFAWVAMNVFEARQEEGDQP